MKKSLVALGMLLAAGSIAWLAWSARPDAEKMTASTPTASTPTASTPTASTPTGLTFEVRMERPRSARPLFGILPDALEEELLDEAEFFDHQSPEAELHLRQPGPEPGRLEASAAGWRLVLGIDAQGRATAASQLVFPFGVGGRQVSLRCHPAQPAVGFLRIDRRPGSATADGTFSIEFVRCENADSGAAVNWPPELPFGLPRSPLVIDGDFSAAAFERPAL